MAEFKSGEKVEITIIPKKVFLQKLTWNVGFPTFNTLQNSFCFKFLVRGVCFTFSNGFELGIKYGVFGYTNLFVPKKNNLWPSKSLFANLEVKHALKDSK